MSTTKKLSKAPIDVRDDVGVIQRRILLAAVARRDRIGPAFVRPIGHAERGAPVRNIGHALADHGGRLARQRIDAGPARIRQDAGIDVSHAAEQLQAVDRDIVLVGRQFDALHPDRVDIADRRRRRLAAGRIGHEVGLRDDRVVGPLLEQRQPDPAIVPLPLDVQFAGEILLRRQIRIGEGRNAADRDVLVELGDGRIAIGLAEIGGDVPVLVRIVGQRRLRREIGRVRVPAD